MQLCFLCFSITEFEKNDQKVMFSKSLSLSAGPMEDFLKDNITALKAREIFLGSLFSQEMFLRPPEMQYVFVIFF